MKHRIPDMYLYYYCFFLNYYTNIIEYGDAKNIVRKLPRILRKPVIDDMIRFGLLKRISKRTIEINKFSKDKLNRMGITLANIAYEQTMKRREQSAAGMKKWE